MEFLTIFVVVSSVAQQHSNNTTLICYDLFLQKGLHRIHSALHFDATVEKEERRLSDARAISSAPGQRVIRIFIQTLKKLSRQVRVQKEA